MVADAKANAAMAALVVINIKVAPFRVHFLKLPKLHAQPAIEELLF